MSRSLFVTTALLMLPLANVTPANAQGADDFPEGQGKQFVQQICMQCHDPQFLLKQRRTEEDWKKTVTRMSQKGAGGPIENYNAVAAYMAKNFGKEEDTTKVNVNKASVDELVAKVGLTKDEAAAVIGYRERNGSFHEWGDMLVIYGVDGRNIEAAKDKMTF
jgi:competence protein ComEA